MDRFVRERGSYAFGRFQMDPARRTLTRDGAEVALTPMVFDTLLYLVEHPDGVVTKEELLAAVWPGRFVEESNLTQMIFLLRKVLRDAGDDGRLIVTAPGRGYRFTADVRAVMGPVPADTAPEPRGEDAAAAVFVAPEAGAAPGRPRRRHPLAGPVPTAAVLAFAALTAAVLAFAALTAAVLAMGAFVSWKTLAPAPANTLAVLPFANLSGDPTQDYFSDGLSEELIGALARLKPLHVIGRTSSFHFKGSHADSATIGGKLGVVWLLDGSVRRDGEMVRVSAELADARTGYERWSATYDRDLKDIFAVQSGIAQAVADALKVQLFGGDIAALSQDGTSSPEAYDSYLRGRHLLEQGAGEADYRQALAHFDTAIAADPHYASA